MTAVAPTLTSSLNPCPNVAIYVPSLNRTNLLANPSFEVNTTGWTSTNGALSVTTGGSATVAGSKILQSIPPAAAITGITLSGTLAITANAQYTFSIYVSQSDGNSNTFAFIPRIEWFNSGGASLGITYGTAVTPAFLSAAPAFTRINVTATAPSSAARANVGIYSSTAVGAGDAFFFDAALFEMSPAVGSYFEGTQTDTPDTATVWRMADGTTETVRNAINMAVNSAFVAVDYEAPIGIPVSYQVETFQNGISLGLSAANTITVTDARLWITDPLNPRNSMAIQMGGYGTATLGKNTFENIKRAYKYTKSVVIGKARPVLQFYGQKGIEGAQFEVLTHDAGDIAIEGLITVAPVLIRVPVSMPNLPARLYGIMEPDQQPQSWRSETQNQLTLWSIKFTETEPQAQGITFSVYSYAYWATRFGSYPYNASALASYNVSTYLNAIQNPPA